MNRKIIDKWRNMVKKRVESELRPILGDNFDSVEINTYPNDYSQAVSIDVLSKKPFNQEFSDKVYVKRRTIEEIIKHYPIMFNDILPSSKKRWVSR